MVIVKYSGPEQPRYAQITSRGDLSDCICWLLTILDNMELKGKEEDVVIDLIDYEGEG
jgi:hypothetical protein